jgi:hypothetical protein
LPQPALGGSSGDAGLEEWQRDRFNFAGTELGSVNIVDMGDQGDVALLDAGQAISQLVPIQGSGQLGANIATAEPLTAA